jgi:adiponectin receptor
VSILAMFCAVATLHPSFRNPNFRPYRAVMYTGLGLSAVLFILHGIFLYGWSVQNQRMSLDWMLLMASLNFIGAGFYVARVRSPTLDAYRPYNCQVPEKWYPQTFDYFGASHQILHFMVIFAGLAHMVGLFRAFDYVRTYEI